MRKPISASVPHMITSISTRPRSRQTVKRKVALLFCVVLIAWLVGVIVYPKFKRIEKNGPAIGNVADIVAVNPNVAATAIRNTFNNWSDYVNRRSGSDPYRNKFPADLKWSHLFLFSKGDPVFPSDQEILVDRGVDSFVENYVHIPAERRSSDFYLYEPTADYYWSSEYVYQQKPAKFRCSFLIHLESAADGATRIEIFEYQPTIWVGNYFGLSAHAIFPTTLYDIRSAEATTSDRQELLTTIEHTGISGMTR